jgi:lipopolysaccharide/colanic/teichoic acid biosynthesis glycosyltransferase
MLAPKPESSHNFYRRVGKRGLDCVCATLLLICLMPVMCLTALLVRWQLGSPVLFRQARAGLNGQVFTLLKFRSMLDSKDAVGQPLSDAARLTRFGKVIRQLSLDELPQCWNVIRGDMSLVGPRPLMATYLGRYDSHQARRHEVRPGITGLAQVQGRNDLSWPEKFELDVEYVDRLSFWLDIRILLATVGRLVSPQGVATTGHATTTEFLGNQETSTTTSNQTSNLNTRAQL